MNKKTHTGTFMKTLLRTLLFTLSALIMSANLLASESTTFASIGQTTKTILINGVAPIYGTMMAGVIGHELGHALLPVLYSEKVGIYISPWCHGHITHPSGNFPKKLLPIVCGLGPISGIAASFSLLKAANIYRAFTNYPFNDPFAKKLKNSIYLGLKSPMVYDENAILTLGATCSILHNATCYSKWPAEKNNITDGQRICEHFKLSKGKAFLARSGMTLGTMAVAGSILKKSYDKSKNFGYYDELRRNK